MLVNIFRLTTNDTLDHASEFRTLVFNHMYTEIEKIAIGDVHALPVSELYEYATEELSIHMLDENTFLATAYDGGIYVDDMQEAEDILDEVFHEALKDCLAEQVQALMYKDGGE